MIVEGNPVLYYPGMPRSSAAKSAKTFRRNTQQRREIREVFEQNDRPLAADEVLQLAQARVAGLGMATVYRTIKGLIDEGWLIAVEVPGQPPRYEVRGKAHHHHFHCLKCQRLFELEGCLEHLEKLIPSTFRVVDHVVLIYGYCAECDRAHKAQPAPRDRSGARASRRQPEGRRRTDRRRADLLELSPTVRGPRLSG
ncbi:MAG TPA: transcriptional repressor [Blastocatellia bacterium]|nr:transcriptional repressor [Blastocatellia bacterium]